MDCNGAKLCLVIEQLLAEVRLQASSVASLGYARSLMRHRSNIHIDRRLSARQRSRMARSTCAPGTNWCVADCTPAHAGFDCESASFAYPYHSSHLHMKVTCSCRAHSLLLQRHGMHRLEDVVKNLKEERDTRSQRSVYGEQSSVGKGVNKDKGAAPKDGKAAAKQQKPDRKAQAQPQSQPQHQQHQQQVAPSPDAEPASNGDANGSVADVDSAVAQSIAEKLVL